MLTKTLQMSAFGGTTIVKWESTALTLTGPSGSMFRKFETPADAEFFYNVIQPDTDLETLKFFRFVSG